VYRATKGSALSSFIGSVIAVATLSAWFFYGNEASHRGCSESFRRLSGVAVLNGLVEIASTILTLLILPALYQHAIAGMAPVSSYSIGKPQKRSFFTQR